MVTLRWRTNPFDLLGRQMHRLVDDFNGATEFTSTYPPVDLWEDENNLYVEAELPGMQLDKIEVFVADKNTVTIQGERQVPEVKGTAHRQERGFGAFSRLVQLPLDVQADKVEARYEQGILRLTLPKAEHVKPRRVTVKGE